jgi:hypothetical protein
MMGRQIQGSSKPVISVFTVVAIISVAAQLPGQPPWRSGEARLGSSAFNAVPDADEDTPKERVREGTELHKIEGVFKMVGDRIAFYSGEDKEPFRILENLALERIWRMLDQARGRTWIVSGTVTEYRGGNFLLVSRAVLKSRLRETKTLSAP